MVPSNKTVLRHSVSYVLRADNVLPTRNADRFVVSQSMMNGRDLRFSIRVVTGTFAFFSNQGNTVWNSTQTGTLVIDRTYPMYLRSYVVPLTDYYSVLGWLEYFLYQRSGCGRKCCDDLQDGFWKFT